MKAELIVDAVVKRSFTTAADGKAYKTKKHSKVYKEVPVSVALPQMSAPAEISEDGLRGRLKKPKGITAFCFGVVDSNDSHQYTQVTPAQ